MAFFMMYLRASDELAILLPFREKTMMSFTVDFLR